VYGHTDNVSLDFGTSNPRVGAYVGLVEDHRWLSTAGPNASEVALDPAHVEVGVEATHDEDQVDVRRDHLDARLPPSGTPGEHGAPLENAFDDGRALRTGNVVDDNPVTDTGRPSILELEAKSSRELSTARARSRQNLVSTAVLGRDAGDDDFVSA
jgi:hypothetical protein